MREAAEGGTVAGGVGRSPVVDGTTGMVGEG